MLCPMENNYSFSQPPAVLPYQNRMTDHHQQERQMRRPYRRSQLPRLTWTRDLHRAFCNAVQTLGGPYQATPKMIHEDMKVEGITIAHIQSHLQMYRNVSKEQLIQVGRPEEGGRVKEAVRLLEDPEVEEEVYRRMLATVNTNAVTVLVPEKGEKRHHSYILFKDILVGSPF